MKVNETIKKKIKTSTTSTSVLYCLLFRSIVTSKNDVQLTWTGIKTDTKLLIHLEATASMNVSITK